MTFVCIVCRELLTNHPHHDDTVVGATGGARPKANIDIVSTKCGHMYHLICLNDWFNKQVNPRQECPYCKSAVVSRDYQRIFPIGDEETDDIETCLEKAKEMQVESAILKSEIQQFESILEETGTQLQDKTLALDILQYEFNQKLDEVNVHKEENKFLKDSVQMLEAEVSSLHETRKKEKLSWDRKLGEVTRKMASLQAELDAKSQKPRFDESAMFNSTNSNQDLLLTEIRSLRGHMLNMNLSSTPKRSMGCQTDFALLTPDIMDSMSLKEMLNVCMKLLEKEDATPAERLSAFKQPSQPDLPVHIEAQRPTTTPANIRANFRQAVQEAATSSNSTRETNSNQMKPETRRPVAAKRALNQPRAPVWTPEESDSSLGAVGGFPTNFTFSMPSAHNQDYHLQRQSDNNGSDDGRNISSTRWNQFT